MQVNIDKTKKYFFMDTSFIKSIPVFAKYRKP